MLPYSHSKSVQLHGEAMLDLCSALKHPACLLSSECLALNANMEFRQLHSLLSEPKFPLQFLEMLPSLRSTSIEHVLLNMPAAGERIEIDGSVATQFLDSLVLGLEGGVLLIHLDRAERRRQDEEHWQLIDSLAHSMKTPLASIRGYAETLQIAMPDGQGKTDEYLGNIMRLTGSLNRTINDLFFLSRLDRAGFPDPLEATDIRQITEDVIDSRRESAAKSDVKLQLTVVDVLPRVFANKPALHEVIYNLIDNAIKYSPHGGEVHVSLDLAESSVLLSVHDSGIGIPADEQPRIFERFFRASAARAGDYQGAGLGLSKVHSVVKQLGGSVRLESAVAVGSTFIVELPSA